MNKEERIISAVIIARGGSKRLPGKNVKDFHGSSLIAHKVKQLMNSCLIRYVFVGSDDDEILREAKKAGAIPIWRDKPFCDEKTASWNEVISDMCSSVIGDVVVWAHCTNPLIDYPTYDDAIRAYFSASRSGSADSLVSVTRVQSHLWKDGAPFNFNPKSGKHPVAKELKPVFYQNGGIFIAKRHDMMDWRYVYNNPVLFELSQTESIDIDTAEDFKIAEALYEAR